ncbi:MAG: hypothetical protein A2521_13625 [Deltaproteobacteria bacterium RIFOXYD12_FULL_57_12]|nr:MAG: hypothetical protein A2521_13625 [Deltaproteobacteria bacterium RIFOXYD12_FULL_57_12]
MSILPFFWILDPDIYTQGASHNRPCALPDMRIVIIFREDARKPLAFLLQPLCDRAGTTCYDIIWNGTKKKKSKKIASPTHSLNPDKRDKYLHEIIFCQKHAEYYF